MAYCDRCERYFVNERALWQHEGDSPNHWFCEDCNLDFPTHHGRKEHWVQSPKHDYCQHCNLHFEDSYDLNEHMNNAHFYCSKCSRVFTNAFGLQEHYRQSSNHHYCFDCKRDFASASNLNSHLNSSTHQQKTVPCPSRACGQFFVSRSAMVLHLEGGRCPSEINRATVNRLVRQNDRNNLITDPRMLTNGNSTQEVTYYASSASWNGHAFECYLCHGTYRTLSALNQHLASPKHQDKIYICRYSSCQARFTTLSGFVQHIESEKCGVAKFKAVQNALDGLLGQMKRLTV
ncbi:hypothetical protein C8J56DRAFT_907017 [Mycena floridula]|nr:hypothetical protein C8J56DRAFT_907017 [Mycena floridula]